VPPTCDSPIGYARLGWPRNHVSGPCGKTGRNICIFRCWWRENFAKCVLLQNEAALLRRLCKTRAESARVCAWQLRPATAGGAAPGPPGYFHEEERGLDALAVKC